MVRLNGDVAQIFEDWIHKLMPGKAEKVLNKIRAVHGGKLSDSRFGTRMSGEGEIAQIIKQQINLAKKLYFSNNTKSSYNMDLHVKFKSSQLQFDF